MRASAAHGLRDTDQAYDDANSARRAANPGACAPYAGFSSLLGRAALNLACPRGRVNSKVHDICGASRAADTTDARSRAAARRKAHQRTAIGAQSEAASVPEQPGPLLGARAIFLYYQSDGAFRIPLGSRECAALARRFRERASEAPQRAPCGAS